MTTVAQSSTHTSAQIVADPAKSAEQYMQEAAALYIIPQLVREKFSDLVKLIFETESMNVDEREYWLQIMPIMSEEQISKFRDILVNEKVQLAKLDTEYSREVSRISATPALDETVMKARFEELAQAEEKAEQSEAAEEEDLLKKLGEI